MAVSNTGYGYFRIRQEKLQGLRRYLSGLLGVSAPSVDELLSLTPFGIKYDGAIEHSDVTDLFLTGIERPSDSDWAMLCTGIARFVENGSFLIFHSGEDTFGVSFEYDAEMEAVQGSRTQIEIVLQDDLKILLSVLTLIQEHGLGGPKGETLLKKYWRSEWGDPPTTA